MVIKSLTPDLTDQYWSRAIATLCLLLGFLCQGYTQVPQFKWVATGGERNNELLHAVVADDEGSFYISGADSGIFVQKRNHLGTAVWTARMGAGNANDVAIDHLHNIYYAGVFHDTCDFNPHPDTTLIQYADRETAFLLKLDSNGNFIWFKGLPATVRSYGLKVCTDSGSVIIAGHYSGSIDLDPKGNSFICESLSQKSDIFLAEFSHDGHFRWGGSIGSILDESVSGLKIDNKGNLYVAGTFAGTLDTDPGKSTDQLTCAGGTDGFICRYSKARQKVWNVSFGSTQQDAINAIALDDDGNLFIAGRFTGLVDFDPSPGIFHLKGYHDSKMITAFLCKLDTAGKFRWARQIGEFPSGSRNYNIATDHSGNVYTAGEFFSKVDADPGPGVVQLTAQAPQDVYLLRLNARGEFSGVIQVSGKSSVLRATSIYVGDDNTIGLAGSFYNPKGGYTDFDPGPGNHTVTANAHDWYLLVLKQNFVPNEKDTGSVENPVSTIDIEEIHAAGWSIFPNPVCTTLQIKGGDPHQSLSLIDGRGSVLFQREYEEYPAVIDLSFMKEGVYTLVTGPEHKPLGKILKTCR